MASFSILDTVEQGLAPQSVTIQQFAEDTSFCNKFLYPRQVVLLKLIFLEEMSGAEEDVLTHWMNGGRGGNEVTLSPNIRERRDFLRENGYKHFREIQLVGGRRSSKGFVTGIAMAKIMHDTLMLGDPGQYYGIDREKDIYFSCVAGSESQAKEFQYADLVSTVENCKAFEPFLVKSLETEFRVATNTDLRKMNAAKARGNKILRDIATLRGKALAANAGTLRGSATMAIAIDEMAHMIPGESKASADQVYTASEPSLDQFGLDGIVFLNSSPYTKVGMFYECYEANLRRFDPTEPVAFTNPLDLDSDDVAVSNGNPRNFAFQFPSWALFEGYRKYSSRWKKRTRGQEFGKMITTSPDWNPAEMDDDGDSLYSKDDQAAIIQARAKESANPESYKVERRGKFAEVTDAFLNPTMVDQMYRGVPEGYDHLANGDIVRRYRPIVSNHGEGALNLYRYKFHIDPSSTTAGFGFAIGHIEYFTDPNTGLEMEHVVFDLIKRWDPHAFQGKVIRWKPILDEIVTYAVIFRPFEITFDQHQCLAGDTLISTQHGLLPIATLVNGLDPGQSGKLDMGVMSHHDDSAHATSVYRRGVSETRRITARGGYHVEATPDHRLWMQKNRKKPWSPWPDPIWGYVRDLEVGDRLLVQPGSIVSNQIQSVVDVQFERHRNCSIKRLPDTCDVDLAAYLGWMISEGYVPAQGTGTFTNAEPEAWDDFIGLSERLFGHTPRRQPKSDTTDEARTPRSVNRFLHQLGASGPSHLKVVPPVIFRSPLHVIRAFLRTLFDGDGSVAIRTSTDVEIIYTTESPQLADDLQRLLLTLGMHSTRYQDPYNPALREHPCQRVKLFGSNLVKFVDEIGFVSLRKHTQAQNARMYAGQLTNVRNNRSIEPDGSLWVRIIQLESDYADCYDLTVPGQESFVANGIVSHNSAQPIQDLQETLNQRNVSCRVYEKPATNELNWKRWEVFKTALYQGLIHAPYDEYRNPSPTGAGHFTSADELKFLQQITTQGKFAKVEKQDIGPVQTKDMADCISEVVYTLVGNLHFATMRDRLANAAIAGGAPGGYGIGSGGPVGGPGPPGISGYYSQRGEMMARLGGQEQFARGAIGMQKHRRGMRSRGRW